MTASFRFERFAPTHVQLMQHWLRRPHVADWWDGVPTLEEIRAEYCEASGVDPYVAHLDERPVAFIQSYRAMGSGDGWWEEETDPGVVGIDQFIGEADLLGQGIGTALIGRFVDRLLEDDSVTRIQVDPHPRNQRAIRCYEKVGFVGQREIVTPDGPAWYMLLDRASRAARIE
jgi:aminoglycoside 6'-N-acetyltransferase Ib